MSTATSIPDKKAQPDALSAHRTGVLQYEAQNDRGAKILIGRQEGAFTPGELLKLALATCNALTAEKRLTQSLGEDFNAKVGIATVDAAEGNRFESFEVDLTVDLSVLNEEQITDLSDRVQTVLARYCTVGRTLNQAASFETRLLAKNADNTAPEDIAQ